MKFGILGWVDASSVVYQTKRHYFLHNEASMVKIRRFKTPGTCDRVRVKAYD